MAAAAALLHLGEKVANGGEHESARDTLQQAADRADALDLPTVAASAGRLLGTTVV